MVWGSSPAHLRLERVIRWNDPEIDIDWPVEDPLLAEKDRDASRLKDLPTEVLPTYNP